MGIKQNLKRILLRINSDLTDLLYRRPYRDAEAGERKRSKDKLLHLDLVITECCTRKCRDCSNLMQYYKSPENIPDITVINDLSRVLDCVRVGELKVLGGEPFVNQQLIIKLMQFLSADYADKVDRINIITNGTVIPYDDCIEAIKANSKAEVTFSNYGLVSCHQDEFVDLLKNNGIPYTIVNGTYTWFDFGRPDKYYESEEFVQRQYKHCYNRKNCNTLYRGGFYVCPRQAHGIHLELLPNSEDEYVDINDVHITTNDELRERIMKLIRRNQHISACHYCIYGKYIHVPRGVQQP